jgi:hypothetical protein
LAEREVRGEVFNQGLKTEFDKMKRAFLEKKAFQHQLKVEKKFLQK